MSAAASPLPYQQELPSLAIGLMSWGKVHLDLPALPVRLKNPTSFVIVTYASLKAAAEMPSANPGETRFDLTMLELRRLTRKSVRCIQYAIEELNGKRFIEVTSDPRAPGRWSVRLLPENWRQGQGGPGAPIQKAPRKAKVRTAGHEYQWRKAALMQPTARCAAADSPQTIAAETPAPPAQSIAQEFVASEKRTPGEGAQYIAQDFRFDPFTGAPLEKRTTGEDQQCIAQDQPSFMASAGEEPQRDEMHQNATGNAVRTQTQPEAGNPAVDSGHPIRERVYGREEEKLASPPQPIAEADLARLISENRILPHLGMPNEGTCRNLLDRNKYQGPGVPGAPEVATFLARNQDRPSWTGWGVVVKAIREDLMPWLFRTGWAARTGIWALTESAPPPAIIPTPESLAEAEAVSRMTRAAETEQLAAAELEAAVAQIRGEQVAAAGKAVEHHQLAEKILANPQMLIDGQRFWPEKQVQWAKAIIEWENGTCIEHPGQFPEHNDK